MITIDLQFNKSDELLDFRISGHSGYSDAGSDIVCAAVSAIAQTALLGLLEYGGESVQYEIEDGLLSVHVAQHNAEAAVILKTMVLGLEQVAQHYKDFVVLNR